MTEPKRPVNPHDPELLAHISGGKTWTVTDGPHRIRPLDDLLNENDDENDDENESE